MIESERWLPWLRSSSPRSRMFTRFSGSPSAMDSSLLSGSTFKNDTGIRYSTPQAASASTSTSASSLNRPRKSSPEQPLRRSHSPRALCFLPL